MTQKCKGDQGNCTLLCTSNVNDGNVAVDATKEIPQKNNYETSYNLEATVPDRGEVGALFLEANTKKKKEIHSLHKGQ
jgi:hypothetical protein